MRKKIGLILVAIGLACSLAVATPAAADAPTVATSVTAVTQHFETFIDSKAVPASAEKAEFCCPYNNHLFASRYVCQDNNIGTYWRINEAGSAFESGLNGIVLSYSPPGQNCGGPDSQIIHYSTYNASDGHCGKVTGNTQYRSSDGNYIYTGNVQLQMNTNPAYSSCYNNLQRRDNEISVATGQTIGLNGYYDPNEVCIMNSARRYINDFAQPCDVARVNVIY